MDCEKYENLIPLYLDGELTEVQVNSLRQHLEGCPKCREQLNALQYMQSMLGKDDESLKAPAKMKARIYARLYRDLLIIFAGLVIIVSMVAISGGLAQMFLIDKMTTVLKTFFFAGIILIIVGLVILTYDIFVDIFKISIKKNKL